MLQEEGFIGIQTRIAMLEHFYPQVYSTMTLLGRLDMDISVVVEEATADKKRDSEKNQRESFPDPREVLYQVINKPMDLAIREQFCMLFCKGSENFEQEDKKLYAITTNDLAIEANQLFCY